MPPVGSELVSGEHRDRDGGCGTEKEAEVSRRVRELTDKIVGTNSSCSRIRGGPSPSHELAPKQVQEEKSARLGSAMTATASSSSTQTA